MEEDLLYSATKFYRDNLNGKDFCLVAGKKGNTATFSISFRSEQFKHLLGLEKLKDIPELQARSSMVYNAILKKKISYSDIIKSKYYHQMENRLKHFQDLKTALYSKELMIRSLHGEFNLIKADFMLTKTDLSKYGYAHLFFKTDNEGISIPITYIIHPNNAYLQNNPNKWTVLSIEEVKKPTLSKKTKPTVGNASEHEHER